MSFQRTIQFQAIIVLISATMVTGSVQAGIIFGSNDLTGGFHWDAAARNIAGVGERSLDGGLRYSVQGGSFEAYRDLFSWTGVAPTVAAFTTGVQQAFDFWSAVDPFSGLGTDLTFVSDLGTDVVGNNTGNGGLSVLGAEIDLFGSTDAFFWNVGNTGTQAETSTGALAAGNTVTLTSGTANYAGSRAISGSDIIINSNAGAVYSLDLFVRLLSHEIGHSLGFGDVESVINSNFIDDNFDDTNDATRLATLTNSWASLVNVNNPAASALNIFNIGNATNITGVDMLMQSFGLGIEASNPIGGGNPLRNDDYSMRQFLYPFIAVAVPAPGTLGLLILGLGALGFARRRHSLGHRVLGSEFWGQSKVPG